MTSPSNFLRIAYDSLSLCTKFSMVLWLLEYKSLSKGVTSI